MKNYTLKEMRCLKMKTQKQVALDVGITETYLSLIECGKKRPSDKIKRKLAREYQVKIVDILKAVEKVMEGN